MVSYGLAQAAEKAGAVAVWRAANLSRGRPAPTPERVARVEEKLAEPGRLLVVGRADSDVVAMALAEPGLADDGHGPGVEGLGHVAMVFVAPDHQGRGVGTGLMAELARAGREVGWIRLIVWTGVANTRAHRLYERCGFVATGRFRDKGGFAIRQFAVDLAAGGRLDGRLDGRT